MTRLIQLKNGDERRVALVDEPHLLLLADCASVCELANLAIDTRAPLTDAARKRVTHDRLDYDLIYSGRSDWRILPPIDHPDDPARCLISGHRLDAHG